MRGDRFFNEKMAGTTALELMVDATHGGWFNSKEGLAALGSLEWVLARVPSCWRCQLSLQRRGENQLVTRRGLSYNAYRAALRSWTLSAHDRAM